MGRLKVWDTNLSSWRYIDNAAYQTTSFVQNSASSSYSLTSSYSELSNNAVNLATTNSITLDGYKLTGSYYSVVTSNTYTLLPTDNGKMVIFLTGSNGVIFVTGSLPYGFNCSIYQSGSGKFVVSESKSTIRNAQSQYSSYGQYSLCSIIRIDGGDFIFQGLTTV